MGFRVCFHSLKKLQLKKFSSNTGGDGHSKKERPDDCEKGWQGLKCVENVKSDHLTMRFMFQPEVTLFGPHDTSRASETDLPYFSSNGRL